MPKKALKEILDDTLEVYSGPAEEKNPQYKAFYDEIVTRCVADVAGMLQSSNKKDVARNKQASRFLGSTDEGESFDSRPGNELHAMFRSIAGVHGEDKARDMILGNLPGFTKGIVYTPHPTELLGEEGIEAQEKLMAALIRTPKLFEDMKRGQNAYLTSDERNKLHTALKEVADTIMTPVSKQLTIDQEMRRSVRFSQRQFDSIPGIADTILAATNTSSSSQLTVEQLRKFAHLIEPETWSPGDQDSKPDMTAEKLQQGANLSRRAIMFHYYRTLAALGANIPGGSSPEKDEATEAINTMMHRLLKTGWEAYEHPKELTSAAARAKLTGVSEARVNGPTQFSDRYASYADSGFFKKFEKGFTAQTAEAKPYASADEFLNDLINLRARPVISGIKDDKRQSVSVIDSLIIQTMNFRDSALRIQVRQNAEMHAHVLDTLLDQLPATTLPAGVKGHLHNEKDASSIEKLLAAFQADPKFREEMQKTVSSHLATVKQKLGNLPPETDPAYAEKKAGLINEIGKKDYEAYETMSTLGLAASHPDQIPRYLIAECRSKTDLLEAFFLLKVMESAQGKDAKGKVEIVNLVEHPDLVKEDPKTHSCIAAQMTAGAMENAQFRDHHTSITSFNHLLKSYSLKDGEHDMTVAEAKRTYGLKVAEGDETRKVAGVKMMMGAGSDITKAGSSAAAAAMMDAVEKTREALLNNKECPTLLIDYIGCGGGVHRTQPVSTSYETVQGQSMRQSPENIAQKTLGLLTDFLFKRLALNPENEEGKPQSTFLAKHQATGEHKTMYRVNMGNLARLPLNEAMWQANTKERTYAMMDKWGKLYESDEFRELMSYTADMYANLTKFAARPATRVGAEKKPQGYLAPVNVKETRAIGFGAALNCAGISAPLYFGGNEYLDIKDSKDEEKLRAMYMYDPKAQDTINRMTYGVLMANMDVAWKYLGREYPPTRSELETLAASKPSYADRANPTGQERKVMAEKGLAEINVEYNQVAGKLLRLHQFAMGEARSEITDGKQAADQLLATLPIALREQISLSREHIRKPREALATLFMEMGKGTVDPKTVTKDSVAYEQVIYPSMAALFECFEHVPRAYSRPKWVQATELDNQRAV